LVAWNTIFKPKAKGGLGLRDLEILNQTLGAKTWWRWLQQKGELWSKLWKYKYVGQLDQAELIHMLEAPSGSLIWNSSWKNKGLYNNIVYGRLGMGNQPSFGRTLGRQLPALHQDPQWDILKPSLQLTQGIQVKKYWQDIRQAKEWKIWHLDPDHISLMGHLLSALKQTLDQRKIKVNTQPDKLRWGYFPTGNFTLKEAYHLTAQHISLPDDIIWKKIWKGNLWPKVATFLWKTAHQKILTWDQLCKRGFQGPGLCSMCKENSETMEHLLNSFSFSNTLWDQGAISFQKSYHNKDSIRSTISSW
jgi:hypothetical protein